MISTLNLEKMTVSEGLKFVEDAFNKFCEESKSNTISKTALSKSFAQKLFSCLVCDH